VLNGQTLAAEWTYPSGFGAYMRVGDIDDDGRDELVAGASWYDITAYDAELQSPKWQIPVDLDLDALQLADVEPDNSLDVVYGDGQWGAIYVHDGATGGYKWSINNPEHGVTDIAVGDSDNDGENEILWGAGFSSTGPDYLFVHDVATQAREWRSADIDGPFYAMDYGDVDDDSEPEILYGCISSESGYGDGLWFVHDAVTKALEYQSDEPTGSDWMGLWRVRHGNVDDDPQAEVFIITSRAYTGYIQAYDGLTHTLEWEAQTVGSGQGFVSMAVADVDDDNTLEIVAGVFKEHTGSPGEYLYVFDGVTGAEEWRSVALGSGWPSLSLLRVADVDDDANLEMLVSVFGGALYVYDGVTHVEEVQSFDLDITALDVADVDGDDQIDIVIGNSSGALHVIDVETGGIMTTIGNYGGQIDGLSVVDVNLDVVPDYVFAVGNELYIYNGADPAQALWGSGVIGSSVGRNDSIMSGDFDVDGNLEIMVNLGATGAAIYEVDVSFIDCNSNGIPDAIDIVEGTSQDCQPNDIPDDCDIASGTSQDATGNGIPDECEEDCNGNGTSDADDIAAGTSKDCNENSVPDECDVTGGTSPDCQPNGVPDECGIAAGTSEDCNVNTIPDECDITGNTSEDCNLNMAPDECDVLQGSSLDLNGNGIPDECDPDCNQNGFPDFLDLWYGVSPDCNGNTVPDECDIAAGTSEDLNSNDVPDECEEPGCPCIYDLDNSCFIDATDLGLFAGCWLCEQGLPCWTEDDCAMKDWDDSGIVDAADLGLFAGAWLMGCDELDPTQYVGAWYCEGEIICPWPASPPGRRTPTSEVDTPAP
jgi:hypothetical protein